MYNVGQADNLLSAGRVQYPSYKIGSLNNEDDYPCLYNPPNNAEKPVSIPLGTYDNFQTSNYLERYVRDTQQKRAGEMDDLTLLIVMIILFIVLCTCVFLSF